MKWLSLKNRKRNGVEPCGLAPFLCVWRKNSVFEGFYERKCNVLKKIHKNLRIFSEKRKIWHFPIGIESERGNKLTSRCMKGGENVGIKCVANGNGVPSI